MKATHLPILKAVVLFTLFFAGCAPEQKHNQDPFTWEQSNPQAEGFSQAILDSIHNDIQQGRYGLMDHFLLIRNGKIVVDNHYDQDYKTISKCYDTTRHLYNYDYPDWHPYYQYSDLHSLQSVSKSVTSLLLGIATDEGLVIPLDSSVLPLFKDYDFDRNDERKKAITLRNLLTMQSGIDWDESSSYADDASNNCSVMERTEDWIHYVLNRPMDTIPGTTWVYNSGVTMLLGKIVAMATGKQLDQYAEEKLFGPLGITDYYWKKTPKEEIDAEGGLYLAPQDLAKIGYMVLQKGRWRDKQIVSEDWLNQSVQPSVRLNNRMAYGFQWWKKVQDDQVFSYSMRGYGGQDVHVIPDYNIVMVTNAWNIHGDPEKLSEEMFFDRILPTLKNKE